MAMTEIDEDRLESDLVYRFDYLAEFMGFSQDDMAAIQASGPYLGPLIPQIVESTYERLLRYNATARHFVPRQSGFTGPSPPNLAALTENHPQVQFRKEHLARYFTQILGRTCDSQMVRYFDMVGKIHTPQAGNGDIDVPLVQMNALMGFISDTLCDLIHSLPLEPPTAHRTLRAFNKLLWIQNDAIVRHYQQARD